MTKKISMKNLEKKLSKFGSIPGLSRIKKLLKNWNNPQNNMRVILITGTNGKGSTTAYLSSILKEAGYKTGSFYSPHLIRYNERIRINGIEISDKDFKKYENLILNYLKKENKITLFEALTAIAYKYFSDNSCDFAVMEIGMGGRFDATNIAKEEIGIITSIGLEHTIHLGNTIEKIAFEKAGIIKNGIGICGEKNISAIKVIKKECKKRERKCLFLNKDFEIKNIRCFENKTYFDYFGKNIYKSIKLNMAGNYQAQNASLALKASEILKINKKAILNGLKNAKIRGRMELISKNPRILLDVAHNPHGINYLVQNLKLFKYKRLICIFGVMKDKNWKKMIIQLDPYISEWIFPKTNIKRALDPKNLIKFLKKGKLFKNPKKSMEYARKISKKEDLIIVCGSIYFAEKLLEFF